MIQKLCFFIELCVLLLLSTQVPIACARVVTAGDCRQCVGKSSNQFCGQTPTGAVDEICRASQASCNMFAYCDTVACCDEKFPVQDQV